MAIISIPTSIAGLSIPGFSLNAPNGPLAALFGNNFGTNILQYPRDLNTSQKGHVVQFTIYDVRPANITEFASQLDKGAFGNAFANGISGIASTVSAAADFAKNFTFENSITSLQNKLSNVDINFQPPTDVFNTSISLYMPETVNFSYDSHYDSGASLTGAAGAALPLVGAIASALQNNEAIKAALYKGGFVFNPQQQVMFSGIDFRRYTMDFVFTPYSAQEATTVNNIIKAFRRAAAPTKIKEAAGLFFNTPSVVEVDFTFNGKTNKNLNKIKRSVLESVKVDYAPNGWAAYQDGQPVQTKMTLDFMELELVTRADIENGF